MSDLQSVSITSHEVKRTDSKPFVTYNIKVSTATRSWTVQRRYNDFAALQVELKSTTGKEPPAPLPPKHSFRFTRSIDDATLIAERRAGLQEYLQRILTTKDPRWRLSYGFLDFLAVSANTGGSQRRSSNTADKLAGYLPSSQPGQMQYTSASWMSEYQTLQNLLRSVRSSLLKRDTLAGMGDAAGSRSAGVESKRTLKELKGRLDALEKGLEEVPGLGQGERGRREGLVAELRDEVGNVDKMAEAGVRVASTASAASASSMGRSGTPVNEASRTALLGSQPQPGRVFGAGAKPQETEETRPMDDQGLVQLQQTKMDQQDSQLQGLSSILRRQLHLGQEIGKEIGEQNEMLDDLSEQVDKTGAKLGRAKRQMNRLG